MLNLNADILHLVITEAQKNAVAHPRWVAAIQRAGRELESNPWIEAKDDHTLLIGSPSGRSYIGNGSCQCEAFSHGQPCWHRAAARLYHRYCEAKEEAPPANWPRELSTGKPMDWYAAKAAVENGTIPPLGERLVRARAEMAELFS